MNNIYTVVVHGKSFVEALTESEAVDISLNVNLTKSILKADLDVSIDSIEYSLKNPCPLTKDSTMDRSGTTCILASTCKKTLNFCNLKNGFNNPNAHLYIIPFYGIVYVQSSENEDYYEEEIIETISESTSANIAAEKDRWTTIEDIIPFDLKEATPGF